LLAPPAPAVPLRPERVPDLDAYACTKCHAEVTAEWAASAHGLAWLDETYQAALREKKRPELCYGCHAPEPVLAGMLTAKPGTRDADRARGVQCESCHEGPTGAMLGLHGTPTDAHASEASPTLAAPGSNELCSSCHSTNIGPVIGIAKDFASANLAEQGLSCVGCHMAPLERSWAEGAPPRAGRSHALQTPRDPAFLRLAFGLTLVRDGDVSVLRIENQAGHRVPGLVGRKLSFQAELLDASGAEVGRGSLALDERAYLPVGGRQEIRFTRAGASVRVRGLHEEPRASAPVSFLDEVLSAQ